MGVWSKLPDEVVESIFSRLSVFDILRAGSTCSRLRLFVSSSSSSSSVSVLLFVFPSNAAFARENACDFSAWVYDGGRNAWLKLSLNFLRSSLPELVYPVASAGGLLCYGLGRDFVICNPISRSWRKLPCLPPIVSMNKRNDGHYLQAFGLLCDSVTGTYDFFIIHQPLWQSEKSSSLMHYSSSLLQWRALPSLLISGSYNLFSTTIIFCNSRLYTLWDKRKSFLLFAYSDNIWTKLESPYCTSASSLLSAFLMDFHGSLHMVGVVGDDGWGRPTSVYIWKLHAESNDWMEVTCMPSPILQEFQAHMDFNALQCWGKNGVMYMKSFRSDVLMFELGINKWKWLKGTGIKADLAGLVFEPSLLASV